MHHLRRSLLALVVVVTLLGAACGLPQGSMMVTPVIYQADGLDPLAHVDPAHRTASQLVFYATNRVRRSGSWARPLSYGNGVSDDLQLGMARVRFGEDMTWEELHAASRALRRDQHVELSLTDVWEHASLHFEDLQHRPTPTDGSDRFFNAINTQLALAKRPELVIYVHGAKVDFYDSCVHAADLNHFAGRDMVALAFSWPTHQDIFHYVFGSDVERARTSALALEALLETLAERTTALRINIICWSAGGRVVSRALEDLEHWEQRRHEDPSAARIGTVIFAAPDVPVHEFVERMPELDHIAERVIITASDDDSALQKAAQLMGGGRRIGTAAGALPDEEREALERATRTELVDVSYGYGERGFDISGHRYWFTHPWVASDVVLALRTGFSAEQRGLAPTPFTNVWSFPPDYPARVRTAAREALGSSW